MQPTTTSSRPLAVMAALGAMGTLGTSTRIANADSVRADSTATKPTSQPNGPIPTLALPSSDAPTWSIEATVQDSDQHAESGAYKSHGGMMRASLQIPFARRWHADASATLQLATRNDGDGARHSELAGGVIGAGVGYDLVRHARLRLRWRIMGQTPPLLADGVDDYATAATDFLAARGAFGAASHLSLHLTRQRTWWQLDLGGGVARRRGRVDNAAAYAFAGVGFGARVGPAWFIEANASIAMNEARGGLVVGAMVKRRLGSGALCAGPLLGVVVPTTAFAGLALSRC